MSERVRGGAFRMVLPATWQLFDFDPATQGWSIDRMVRRALGTSDRLEPLRRDAVQTYREVLGGAAERGAFFGATMADEVEGHPVAAAVLAFLVPAPAGRAGTDAEVDQMLLDLSEPVPGEELLDIRPIELSVGRTARLRARMGAGAATPDGIEPMVEVVRFFTPLPPGALLVTAFSTPTLYLSEPLGELFDAMADTITVADGAAP